MAIRLFLEVNMCEKYLIALTLLATVVGLLVFSQETVACGHRLTQSDETYAVYSAALAGITRSSENGEKVELFVINQKTGTDSVSRRTIAQAFKDVGVSLSVEFKDALADFQKQNKESQELVRSFNLGTKYSLVPRADYEDIFKGNNLTQNWANFYRKYPKAAGFITFSKVGFDSERKHALVYREIECGSLCADGSYLLLEKVDGTWKVAKQIGVWAS